MLLMRKMVPPTAIIGRAGNNRKGKAGGEIKRKHDMGEDNDFLMCFIETVVIPEFIPLFANANNKVPVV